MNDGGADAVYAQLMGLLRNLSDEELIDVAEVVVRHLAERRQDPDPEPEKPAATG